MIKSIKIIETTTSPKFNPRQQNNEKDKDASG